jgi:hypothetical protein
MRTSAKERIPARADALVIGLEGCSRGIRSERWWTTMVKPRGSAASGGNAGVRRVGTEDQLGPFAEVLGPIIARTGVTPTAQTIYPVRNVIKG